MRYYDVSEGSVKIDGVDIRDYATSDLRAKFGVVFQNDTLFKDTIRENIRLGRNLTDEQLLEAARRAQALEFIEEQGGLDAPVAIKGANLSGGQKQRLLLARALAGDPDILLLDDSSSALDYRTDSKLREEIRLHCADATKIIIAQRISSIMHAEKIMVLENGNVIGMGTHEELMETCPLYREIGESQIGEGLAKEVHARKAQNEKNGGAVAPFAVFDALQIFDARGDFTDGRRQFAVPGGTVHFGSCGGCDGARTRQSQF